MTARFLIIVSIFLTVFSQRLHADSTRLVSAVESNDVFHALLELRAGTDPDVKNGAGISVLEIAAQAGNFEMCKFLLWHGASPFDSHGNRIADTLSDSINSPTTDNTNANELPSQEDTTQANPQAEISLANEPQQNTDFVPNPVKHLLRAYAFIRKTALPAGSVRHPELVVLYEEMVDYEHPQIKQHYYFNQAEKNGLPGKDDDGNGFVDDVYGWSSVADAPFKINDLQRKTFHELRPELERWVRLYNAEQIRPPDENSDKAWLAMKSSFKNPLAKLFGATRGCSDYDFLDRVIELSHGTHVAGIVLKNSQNRAQIHTVSWQVFGQDLAFTTPYTISSNATPENLAAIIEDQIRPPLIKDGMRGSDYLRYLGPGVVNASMGSEFGAALFEAKQVVEKFGSLENIDLSNADAEVLIQKIATELYIYQSIPFVIAGAENPDTLFVVSAGNSYEDNDKTLQSPAYLSRYFPNTITIAAATKPGGNPSSYSNYGRSSVNLGAPGDQILSYGFELPELYLDGTSMAAPAVSGVAALIRAQHPKISAAKLRRILENSGDIANDWADHNTSKATLNPERALKLAAEAPEVLAAVAKNLVFAHSAQSNPEAFCDALDYSKQAVSLCRTNAEIYWDRAVVLDITGFSAEALVAIDSGLKLAKTSPRLWRSRGIILENLNKNDDAMESYNCCIQLLQNPETNDGYNLSWGLIRRAELLKKLGRLDEAKKVAAQIIRAEGEEALPEDLKALNSGQD